MQKENHELMERFMRLQGLIGRYQMFNHGPMGNPHRGQGRVLSILKMQPSISQKELGYLLDMRNQSLGELLNKLERNGYIARTPSEEDRRTAIIELTPEGAEAAKAMSDAREARSDKSIFSAMNEDEKSQLSEYLERIIAELEKRVGEHEAAFKDIKGWHRSGGHCGHGMPNPQGPGGFSCHGHMPPFGQGHPHGPHGNGCRGHHRDASYEETGCESGKSSEE